MARKSRPLARRARSRQRIQAPRAEPGRGRDRGGGGDRRSGTPSSCPRLEELRFRRVGDAADPPPPAPALTAARLSRRALTANSPHNVLVGENVARITLEDDFPAIDRVEPIAHPGRV